jgi:AraC-like DNA-binding protein
VERRTLRGAAGRDIVRVHCPAVSNLVLQLWRTVEQGSRGIGPECDGLTRAIVAAVVRFAHTPATPFISAADASVAYIRENLDKPLSAASLAARCGLCERHFRREFHRLTGQSPRRYVEKHRMQTAAHWLQQTRTPVADIAAMVGYRDPLHFSRVFRRMTGHSPRELRAPHVVTKKRGRR